MEANKTTQALRLRERAINRVATESGAMPTAIENFLYGSGGTHGVVEISLSADRLTVLVARWTNVSVVKDYGDDAGKRQKLTHRRFLVSGGIRGPIRLQLSPVSLRSIWP